MSEMHTIRAILNYAHFCTDLYLDRFNSGKFTKEYRSKKTGQIRKYFIRGCMAGTSDIGGTFLQSDGVGRSIYIECKQPGESLKAEQEKFRDKVVRLGAIYILAFSLDDVVEALKKHRGQK